MTALEILRDTVGLATIVLALAISVAATRERHERNQWRP